MLILRCTYTLGASSAFLISKENDLSTNSEMLRTYVSLSDAFRHSRYEGRRKSLEPWTNETSELGK